MGEICDRLEDADGVKRRRVDANESQKQNESFQMCDGPNAPPLLKPVVTPQHRGSKLIVINHKHLESRGGAGGSIHNKGE